MTSDELQRIFRVLSFDKGPAITYETFSEHLDPLSKGYYIGYSQRVAEKHVIQQDYFKKRVELKNEQAKNATEQLMLENSIAHLSESNRRLSGYLEQQSAEKRLFEEELLAYRLRRNI